MIQNIKHITTFDIELDNVASDKSISHRCALFSLLSNKPSTIRNYLQAEDTLNSLQIIEALGAKIRTINANTISIIPPKQIQEPSTILNCGNSGTLMRLLCGFLASQKGLFILSGDQYLNQRPMQRIIDPLNSIGANLKARKQNQAPIVIYNTSRLKCFNYKSSIASAQVKTALIFAALAADGTSYFKEPSLSRNHSEIMLKALGAKIEQKANHQLAIHPLTKPLKPLDIDIPNDPSSAFFFAVAACIVPNSRIFLKRILLNPTRIQAFKVLEAMGAKINYNYHDDELEKVGDILVQYSPLHAIHLKDHIAWLIDEIPALSIAMLFAKGTSKVSNASELRVKESDRIKATVANLKRTRANVKEQDDGFEITGVASIFDLKPTVFDSFGDHRIAMSFSILALVLKGSTVRNTNCVNTSFATFYELLDKL